MDKLYESLKEIKELLGGEYTVVRDDGLTIGIIEAITVGNIFERADSAMVEYEESLKYRIVNDGEGNYYRLSIVLAHQFEIDIDVVETEKDFQEFYDSYQQYLTDER